MNRDLTYLLLAFAMILAANARGETSIDHLGIMTGLSNGYVRNVTQDPSGYIWVATEDGLNRYDGKRFSTFNKENSGLGANELNCVAQIPTDPDRLWIATQRNGLYYYTHSTGEISKFNVTGINDGSITDITPAAQSGMWLTNFHFGVYYYNPANGETRNYNRHNIPDLPPRFWTAVEATDGSLYIGHEKGGFSVVDTVSHTMVNFRHIPGEPSLPGDQVYVICQDFNGNVWLGTDLGAALFNPVTRKITPFVHSDSDPGSIAAGRVRDIRQLDNGEIWFATSQGGVSILAPEDIAGGPGKIRFRAIPVAGAPKGTSSAYVKSVFQDSFGNVWLGNYRTGLDVISHIDPPISRVDYLMGNDTGFSHKPAWSCHIGQSGSLWIGGENEIVRCQGGSQRIIPLPEPASKGKTFVRAIREDSRGNVWIGTYDRGAMIYSPASGTFTPVDGLPLDVRVFTEDISGNMWVGADGGVFLCEGGKSNATWVKKINDALYDHVIQSIVFDRKGNLWIGTFGKGIAIFTPSLVCMTHLEEATGFPSNAINALICDSKGKIWAATRGGIVLIPDPVHDFNGYARMSQLDEIGVTHVQALVEDIYHNIWASTTRGLVRLDKSGSDATLYGISGNMPLHSFTENAAAADSAGNIYFASGNGVFAVNPKKLSTPVEPLPVFVTGFTVFKEGGNRKENEISIPVLSDRIELPYNQNTFSISFNILDHAMARSTDFAYRMNGVDNVWITSEDGADALYRNLAPGTYRFMVKQRKKGEGWSEPATILTICINPPLWLTWWAKTLYFIIISTLIIITFIFYKNRIQLKQKVITLEENSRNKQKLNEERLRFYTNVTHELRTPLTLILGPLEDLISDPSLPSQHSLKLQMIRDSSTTLLNLINGILEFRKTETQNRRLHVKPGNLSNLIREIGLRFKELNNNPDVDVNLDIEDIGEDIFFDKEMITTVVNNFMSNAMKYTSKGSITLSCHTVTENGVRYTDIRVTDTGQGITEEALGKVFDRYYQADQSDLVSGTGIGLAIVKNLAELHFATVSVESEPGKGSVFTFRIVTDNTYPDAIHDKTEHADKARELSWDGAEGHTRVKVLLVDDNPEICAYVSQSLAHEFDVIVAKNGLEGLRVVQEESPDIVISDIMMPEMDGITMCRIIKEDIQTSHIPVVLLTAKDSLSDKEDGYEAGANSYLTKPFSAKLLTARIHNILRTRKSIVSRIMQQAVRTEPVITETLVPETVLTTPENLQQHGEQSDIRKSKAKKSTHRKENKKTDNRQSDNDVTEIDRQFIERVVELITQNLANPDLSVGFIADKLCMSPSTLYRKVNSLMDLTTNDLIRKVRFDRVKALLLEGKLSKFEIAHATGFTGNSVFAKAFRNEFGMSATEFVAQFQESTPQDSPEATDKPSHNNSPETLNESSHKDSSESSNSDSPEKSPSFEAATETNVNHDNNPG